MSEYKERELCILVPAAYDTIGDKSFLPHPPLLETVSNRFATYELSNSPNPKWPAVRARRQGYRLLMENKGLVNNDAASLFPGRRRRK